jgi:quinol monooxygenase YgiN
VATTVLLELSAEPGQGDALIKAFADVLPDTRAFKGCQSVTVHQSAADPDSLVLIEKWDSAEDHQAYSLWRKDSGTLGGVMGLAGGRPETKILNDVG